MLKHAIILSIFAFAIAVVAPGMARANEADLTATLQEMVTQLSPDQQEGLLLLLSGMRADAAEAEAAQSAKDALLEALARFSQIGEDGAADLAPFYARISEDFNHWAVGGKSGAVNWFESLSPSLFQDGKPMIEFDLAHVEVEEDGDSATAYPIDVFTPLGSVTLEIMAKREADGEWRMVGIDGL